VFNSKKEKRKKKKTYCVQTSNKIINYLGDVWMKRVLSDIILFS